MGMYEKVVIKIPQFEKEEKKYSHPGDNIISAFVRRNCFHFFEIFAASFSHVR